MSRISEALEDVADAVIEQKDYLTELDAKIGDGDHGLNMARGMQAALDAVDKLPHDDEPAPVLQAIGQALLRNVGGAAGPLYGTGFVKAAAACDDSTRLDVASFAKLLSAAITGIEQRGHAQKGDKTMLDTLIPLLDSFQKAEAEGQTLSEALHHAEKVAMAGVDYTRTIAARKGRASLLGDQSIGTEDPGAASACIMYRALYHFLQEY